MRQIDGGFIDVQNTFMSLAFVYALVIEHNVEIWVLCNQPGGAFVVNQIN